MTQRWRLINGKELYDISKDPEQRNDVALLHPDIVSELREGYGLWWQKVSQQFDGTIPIPVGQNPEEPVLLNAHDWRNDPVLCAWNQSLVREGLACNGYWEIDIAFSGCYRIELRRWPKVEDRAIIQGIPGPLVAYRDIKNGYGGGKALPLISARLRIGHNKYQQTISPNDKAVVFTVDLEAGETELQTYLYDNDQNDIGAYYVYVERLRTIPI
jgi:hypothetical protein